jgi:Lhr-like helicase
VGRRQDGIRACLCLLQNRNTLLVSVHPIHPTHATALPQTQERSAVEADFAAGRLRVVVATVAFGMGINLAAVRAVVHATMPRSLEEYVQQVGWCNADL